MAVKIADNRQKNPDFWYKFAYNLTCDNLLSRDNLLSPTKGRAS